MNKSEIIEAIKRLARENGGQAPGSAVVQSQTGIRKADWYPHLWLRWSDALLKAGSAPNQFQTAISDEVLIQGYLMKSGRHHKIGRTVSVGSRERQLAIKIPVPPTTVHAIETDDPRGVEAYWHRRFAEKRGEGEWFDLTPGDIKAFKRWKRIV